MNVGSHEDSAGECCCAESSFSMKLSGFMSKAIKFLSRTLKSDKKSEIWKPQNKLFCN